MKKPLVVLVIAVANSIFASSAMSQVEPSAGNNDDLSISHADLAKVKLAGAGGDASAARQVAIFLEFTQKKPDLAMDWYRTAAENGDRNSACRLAIALKADADEVSRTRGNFWQRRCDGP